MAPLLTFSSSDDLVTEMLLTGRFATVDEAEEAYLDGAISELLEILGSPLSNAELDQHPLIRLLIHRGSRPREDSVL